MSERARKQIAHEKSIKRTRIAIWILVAIAVALGAFVYIRNIPPANGKYDAFAKCIANTSTTFYGAFWCPHCQAQKKDFGNSAEYLPYVECSLPDASGQTQVCIDKGIQSYPTWYFPDGSSSTGEQSLDFIAQKTGCSLPTGTN
jgi:thiol-disulfide isomerase/thioredoxin